MPTVTRLPTPRARRIIAAKGEQISQGADRFVHSDSHSCCLVLLLESFRLSPLDVLSSCRFSALGAESGALRSLACCACPVWRFGGFRVRLDCFRVGCAIGSGGQSAAVESGGTGFPGRPASRMMRGQRGSQHSSSDTQWPTACNAKAGDANATMQAICQRRPARHSGLKKLKDAMTDSQGHGTLPSSFFGAGTDCGPSSI